MLNSFLRLHPGDGCSFARDAVFTRVAVLMEFSGNIFAGVMVWLFVNQEDEFRLWQKRSRKLQIIEIGAGHHYHWRHHWVSRRLRQLEIIEIRHVRVSEMLSLIPKCVALLQPTAKTKENAAKNEKTACWIMLKFQLHQLFTVGITTIHFGESSCQGGRVVKDLVFK